jgi:hypothetical protein
MDPACAGMEEKSQKASQTSGDAAKKRNGLPALCKRKRGKGESGAKKGGSGMERAERAGWETETLFNRGVFLLE